MRPDIAAGLNGIKQTLTGLAIAQGNVAMLPSAGALLGLSGQLVQVFSAENSHGQSLAPSRFAVRSFPRQTAV